MSCIFCEIAQGNIPSRKVYEDEDVLAFLDVNPVTYGHTLVIPKKHCGSYLEADAETIGKVFGVATALSNQLAKALGAEGMNLLSNAGEAAGQTVPHFHVHLIPRYSDEKKDQLKLAFGKVDADLNEVLKQIEQ